jgi:hypothetical protein
LSSAGGNASSPSNTLGAVSALPEGIRVVLELPDTAIISGKINLDWVRPSFTVAKQ